MNLKTLNNDFIINVVVSTLEPTTKALINYSIIVIKDSEIYFVRCTKQYITHQKTSGGI